MYAITSIFIVYLWLVSHPIVFVTHLWILGMYVYICVCMDVIRKEIRQAETQPIPNLWIEVYCYCSVNMLLIFKEDINKETRHIITNFMLCTDGYFLNFFCRTLLGCKILGFPIRIDNKKYARNAFYFNLCFVCDALARSVQFEPVVKKLSDHLVRLFTGDICNYKDIYLCVQCFFMKNMHWDSLF